MITFFHALAAAPARWTLKLWCRLTGRQHIVTRMPMSKEVWLAMGHKAHDMQHCTWTPPTVQNIRQTEWENAVGEAAMSFIMGKHTWDGHSIIKFISMVAWSLRCRAGHDTELVDELYRLSAWIGEKKGFLRFGPGEQYCILLRQPAEATEPKVQDSLKAA